MQYIFVSNRKRNREKVKSRLSAAVTGQVSSTRCVVGAADYERQLQSALMNEEELNATVTRQRVEMADANRKVRTATHSLL
jgi:hypothetical protein